MGGTFLVSTLSTEAIISRMNEKNMDNALIIRPLLDPESQAKSGQAAVDVRLGFEFCLVMPSAFGSLDEFDSISRETFSTLYRREYVPFGDNIIIHPHQFVLAQTLEYVRLPADLMGYVVGRSTWGRLGLIVATAIGIHPGFAGNITLELRNLGETPLTLYPGQTVAQLFFHTVIDENGELNKKKTQDAQYAGTTDMIPRRLSSPNTGKTLEKLIETFNKKP